MLYNKNKDALNKGMMSKESRLVGEEISDGNERYDDSELVIALKKCQREYAPAWKITEEAYAMLYCICGDYNSGIDVKLAKYILTKFNPEPGEKITSDRIANSARILKGDKDPYFIEWLRGIERRKIQGIEKPENDVFRVKEC